MTIPRGKTKDVIKKVIKLCGDSNLTVIDSSKHALKKLKSIIPADMKDVSEKYLKSIS